MPSSIAEGHDAVRAAIRQFMPEARNIKYIEHGHDNFVAVVNNRHVFRFARTNHDAKLQQFETALLGRLQGCITAAEIPKILHTSQSPAFVVTQYIPGYHLTNRDVRYLPETVQTSMGEQIAQFMVQFNNAISGDEVQALRASFGVEVAEPWDKYFKRLFAASNLADPRLRPFVEEWYSAWLAQAERGTDNFAVHDDLHPENLLFKDGQLRGVLDFGYASRGSIEAEMRLLYAIGGQLLQSLINAYTRLTGTQINPQDVRTWAITQDLAYFTDRLAQGQTTHPSYLRARGHLRHWLPNFPF